jgi:hypothetical protein
MERHAHGEAEFRASVDRLLGPGTDVADVVVSFARKGGLPQCAFCHAPLPLRLVLERRANEARYCSPQHQRKAQRERAARRKS